MRGCSGHAAGGVSAGQGATYATRELLRTASKMLTVQALRRTRPAGSDMLRKACKHFLIVPSNSMHCSLSFPALN